ncbi:MAG: DUF1667 domain-containing protein, partial [Clostridiales bacterium]|nr:DUF1667 domain-containing protein [Clostridiales bacterium]
MELTCIICPMGCRLSANLSNNGMSVTGNGCKKGISYAEDEARAPKRVVTTLARTRSGKVFPVKTDDKIDKSLIFDAINTVKNAVAEDTVSPGDIIVKNIFGSGINFI